MVQRISQSHALGGLIRFLDDPNSVKTAMEDKAFKTVSKDAMISLEQELLDRLIPAHSAQENEIVTLDLNVTTTEASASAADRAKNESACSEKRISVVDELQDFVKAKKDEVEKS